jgi:hypothetical protein
MDIMLLFLPYFKQEQINICDKKIEAKQPDFVYNNSKEFIESLNDCISWH